MATSSKARFSALAVGIWKFQLHKDNFNRLADIVQPSRLHYRSLSSVVRKNSVLIKPVISCC